MQTSSRLSQVRQPVHPTPLSACIAALMLICKEQNGNLADWKSCKQVFKVSLSCPVAADPPYKLSLNTLLETDNFKFPHGDDE